MENPFVKSAQNAKRGNPIRRRNAHGSWVRKAGDAFLDRARQLAMGRAAQGDQTALQQCVEQLEHGPAPVRQEQKLSQRVEIPTLCSAEDFERGIGRILDAVYARHISREEGRRLMAMLGTLRKIQNFS
ncbi:hypothetical protein [Magnetofaba australis]|nr:hypothetical protein [Magnetofaba australis]